MREREREREKEREKERERERRREGGREARRSLRWAICVTPRGVAGPTWDVVYPYGYVTGRILIPASINSHAGFSDERRQDMVTAVSLRIYGYPRLRMPTRARGGGGCPGQGAGT